VLNKVFSMQKLNRSSTLLFWAGAVLFAGCASQSPSAPPAPTLRIADANTADVVNAAETVLSRMCFAIEKADAGAGMVRTAPLAGAQFFELWRSDNVGLVDAVQSNVNSIRRSVDLNISPDEGQVRLDCTVRVQRLSLPGEEVASVSQAYRIHSRSLPDLQTFVLTPEQRAQMAWIDLDDDAPLAAEILKRIKKQLARREEEEAS
jgi:hypothetical protein